MTPLKRRAVRVAKEAQDLLETTAELAEETAGQAKGRIRSALERAKDAYAHLSPKKELNKLDRAMHRHFYRTLSIAAGISLLLGFLLAPRSGSK